MKIFEHANITDDWKCPICLTNKDEKVTLISIIGTEEDGNMEAEQIHLNCIELCYDKNYKILYQKI